MLNENILKDNNTEDNTQPCNDKIMYSKTKNGYDISFIEDEKYRKFFSEMDEFVFYGWGLINLLRNKCIKDKAFYNNGNPKLGHRGLLQTRECFSCILKADCIKIQGRNYLSLKIAMSLFYIVNFDIPIDYKNKYYNEIIRTFGKDFDVKDLELQLVYITLKDAKFSFDIYVDKFRFLDKELINYLVMIINNSNITYEECTHYRFTFTLNDVILPIEW